jgi:hypothetical protein
VNAPKKKEFYFRETLTLGKEPDQIEIAGHSYPANARLPKAAYPISYSYSWTDAPVSRLQLDLRDSLSRLTVSGTAVDQVEAICGALERDLLQHSAAAEQPELVEQKPQYTRTRELPALKISFADMQSILEKAANLLSAANVNPPKKKEFYFRETLRLGTEPDEIHIAGHSFPANARLPKAAYALSFTYEWTDAPVSKLDLNLRDFARTLTVSGTAVDQVEAVSATLERDLSQHSAIGGDMLRGLVRYFLFVIFLFAFVLSAGYCITRREWRALGMPIFSLLGLVLVIALPFEDLLAGFAVCQGESSALVRYAPEMAFVGFILTIAGFILSFLIPAWRDNAAQKKDKLPGPSPAADS